MKWQILAAGGDNIVKTLLANRGLKTKKEIDEFLHPPSSDLLAPRHLGINATQLKKGLSRIKKAVKDKEPIVVYGDYDADGICATAIMWEALNGLGAKVMPFIPAREKEGYGLSKEGIDHIGNCTLLITVDSGIVAHEAVEYARSRGLDVIILDHHEKGKRLPNAFSIIHSSKLCASGISYIVARELGAKPSLELAAIATVTDLMDLRGPNRSIVKYGLEALNKTTRPGLKALFTAAGIEKIGTYEIGFMIGPRINASGRIENALTALRLLCTKNFEKAKELAQILNETNRQRQSMVEEQTTHALQTAVSSEKIIVIEHESYHQGVIGLIAGKLVERYYLPAIVIAKGTTLSKASARSINGFNIIEAIRSTEEILVNAGGHPMAAGFTIETSQIANFKLKIVDFARDKITADMLQKTLKIDCQLDSQKINMDLYNSLAQLSPFGIGNPEPIFASDVEVQSLRTVGADGKHLKLVLIPSEVEGSHPIDAIAFNQGRLASELKVGEMIDLAYSLALDTYNGSSKIQLKVKDIHHERSIKEDPRIQS